MKTKNMTEKDKLKKDSGFMNIGHFGFYDWVAQRISAVILAIYTLVFLFSLIFLRNDGYSAWSELFSHFWMKFISLLAVFALCYHAWVGIRDIWMDYVKPQGIRLSLQFLSIIWLLVCGAWAFIILWKV